MSETVNQNKSEIDPELEYDDPEEVQYLSLSRVN